MAVKKKAGNKAGSKKGVSVLSKTMISSVLIIAAAVVIFMILKTVMCKTGIWTGGVC